MRLTAIKALCVLSLLGISMGSCGKKKAKTTVDTLSADTGLPTEAIPPLAAPGTATLKSLPTNPSKLTSTNIQVVGDSLVSYIYALNSDGSTCNEPKYSEAQPLSLPIAIDTGSDGVKVLCVLAQSQDSNGNIKVSLLSYSWLQDSTAPSSQVTHIGTLGPYKQAGATTSIVLDAQDAGSGLKSVELSIQKDGLCLNSQLTAFDTACPHYLLAAAQADQDFTVGIADSLFIDGQSYELASRATDLTGNVQNPPSSLTMTWDATAPQAIASLNATAGQQQVSLSWSAVSDASSYLLVRKAGAAVSLAPTAGQNLLVGEHLGNQNFLAYSGSSLSTTDSNLDPFVSYHYQVFAVDEAGNIAASGARASAQTSDIPAYQGLTNIYLWGPGRRIATEWQRFTASGQTAGSAVYSLFASSSTGAQDFNSAVAVATNKETLAFTDTGTSQNLYAVARSNQSNTSRDSNTRELRLKLAPGTHHKLAANGRFLGQDPLAQSYLRSTWAIRFDPYGNSVFTGVAGTVSAICNETTNAYYCKGRSLGKIYTIAGSDGSDDGTDGALASATAMGDIYGISFDDFGNMYLADSTFFRIRVACYNPLAPGFCNGKTQGYLYSLAGIGASADGLDDSPAKTTAMGAPYAVQVDSYGNVYVADFSFRKIRLVCFDSLHGNCTGKVVGSMYTLAGNGLTTDGNDNLPRLSAALGTPSAMALDSMGNIFFSDNTFFRIRAVCLNVTSGFCSGKTAGNVYRLAGTGVAADGADNALASTAGLGNSRGLVISPAGNLYLTDSTYFRVRSICFENTADSYCSGRTIGNHFRLAGIGTSADGATNALAVTVATGDPRNLALDASGNIAFADNLNKRIRFICSNLTAGSICDGKLVDYHYHMAGSGASTAGWQMNALATPVGTPQGVAEDSYGNIYFGDLTNFNVRVICYDTSHAGFCSGKTAGSTYLVAGNGATGNAADNVLAIANSIGLPYAVAVDSDNNLYIADSTNRYIRVVCSNISGTKFCSGKTAGNMYRYIGTGVAGDAADNVVAASTIGTPGDLAIDSNGNVFIADNQYFRVRVVCQSTSGYCASKTIGKMYRHTGTGASVDGANAGAAATTGIGAPSALALDSWDNVLLGDSTYFRLRVICNNTLGGYCTGKAANAMYRVMGTGVTGDGGDDTAAVAAAIGNPNGLTADDKGNIYLADSTYRRIRAYCVDVTGHYCTGLTAGNLYRMFSNGVSGDSSSGTAGAQVRLDTPSRDSLALSPNGYFIYAGSSGALRMFIGY